MRTLSVIFLVLGLASATGVSPYLNQLYASTRPASPEPTSGRIYEHNVRGGTIVYISKNEHWAVFGSFVGGTLLAIFGAALFAHTKRKGIGAA